MFKAIVIGGLAIAVLGTVACGDVDVEVTASDLPVCGEAGEADCTAAELVLFNPYSNLSELSEVFELRLDEVVRQHTGATGTCDPMNPPMSGEILSDLAASEVVATAVREYTDADIAVQNQGGYRKNDIDLDAPWRGITITRDNLHCMVFSNEIVVLKMSGQAFYNFLDYFNRRSNDSLSTLVGEARPVVSYRPTIGGGDFGNGYEEDAGRIYRVAVNDFLTGRLYRSGALDGTNAFWQYEVYSELGYFILAAHDTGNINIVVQTSDR